MLYFSKIKLFTIYITIIILSFFAFLNFTDEKENYLLSKKVNLGLDLQGGSYLLLEVDSKPVIDQNLQQKVLRLRKDLKNYKIKYQNLNLNNQSINFTLNKKDIEKFTDYFLNKDNLINIYYNQYRSYEMKHFIDQNNIRIEYTKFGLIEV